MTDLIPAAALESHIGKLETRYANAAEIVIDHRFTTDLTIIRRLFDPAIISVDPITGCWLWQGYKINGYGSLSIHDEQALAHRVSCALEIGPIPEGMKVCHECDTPPCIFHGHFFLGTDADNLADMRAKGRGSPPPVFVGVANHKATLSTSEVEAIRIRWNERPSGQRELAAQYGVSQSTIWRLVHRQTRTVS